MGSSEGVVSELAEVQRSLGRLESKVDLLLEDRKQLHQDVKVLKEEAAANKAVAKKMAAVAGVVASLVTSVAAAAATKFFGG